MLSNRSFVSASITALALGISLSGCGAAVSYRDQQVQVKQEAADRSLAHGATYSVVITGAPLDPARVKINGPTRASGTGDVVITLDVAPKADLTFEQHAFDGMIKVPVRYEDSGKRIEGKYYPEQVAFRIHWATGEIRRAASLSVVGPRPLRQDIGFVEWFTVGKVNDEPVLLNKALVANTGSAPIQELNRRDAQIQLDDIQRLRKEYIVDLQGSTRAGRPPVINESGGEQRVADQVQARRHRMDAETAEQVLAKANAFLETNYGFGSRQVVVPLAGIDDHIDLSKVAAAANDQNRIDAMVNELGRIGDNLLLEGRVRATALYDAAALRFVQSKHTEAATLLERAYPLSYEDGDGFLAKLGFGTAHGQILNQRIMDLEGRTKDLQQRDAGKASASAPGKSEVTPAVVPPAPSESPAGSLAPNGAAEPVASVSTPAVQPALAAQPAVSQRTRAQIMADLQLSSSAMVAAIQSGDHKAAGQAQEKHMALIKELQNAKE